MDSQKLIALLKIAENYTIRASFDSSDLYSSIFTLENARDAALNNAPIYLRGGDVAQWQLCLDNAKEFGRAVEELKNVSKVDEQAHEAATSPSNDLPEPSQAQKEAGNYKKGRASISGISFAIENPCGSVRSGTGANGQTWSNRQYAHYGYIEKSQGNDGDELDVYIKEGTADNWRGDVYVVNQIDPKTGNFDEHKCMIGFDTQEEAKSNYLSNYHKGWMGLGAIDKMSWENFKRFAHGDPVFDSAKTPERDKDSPQNIKGKLKDGLFPFTMPDEVRNIIKKWAVVSKSPYSDSFYDITNKSWSDDPDGFLRVADHWNFTTQVADGRVHAQTDKAVVNNKQWALGRYNADKGIYQILGVWDYEKDEDGARSSSQKALLKKAQNNNRLAALNAINDEPSKRVLRAIAEQKNFIGLKSDFLDRKDSSGYKAFDSLVKKEVVTHGYPDLIEKYQDNYPSYVVDFAKSHKRAEKIYWIDKKLQNALKKRLSVDFDSVEETLFELNESEVVWDDSTTEAWKGAAVTFDALNSLERVRLSSEAIEIASAIKQGVKPLDKVKMAGRLVEIAKLLDVRIKPNGAEDFLSIEGVDVYSKDSVRKRLIEVLGDRSSWDDEAVYMSDAIERSVSDSKALTAHYDLDYNELNNSDARFNAELADKWIDESIKTGAALFDGLSLDPVMVKDSLSDADNKIREINTALNRGFGNAYMLANIENRSAAPSESQAEVYHLANSIAKDIGVEEAYKEVEDCRDKFREVLRGNLINDTKRDETEFYDKYKAAEKKLRTLIKKADELYKQTIKEKSPYFLELSRKAKEATAGIEKVGEDLQKKLYEVSGVSEIDAKAWAEAAYSLDGAAKARLKASNYSIEQMKADLSDFYRMTGGKMNHLDLISSGRDRAFTNEIFNGVAVSKIAADKKFSRTTLFHELGHNLEADPKARMLARAFLKRRRESNKLYTLNSLTNGGYGAKEVAFKDSWINPYIGKFYDNGATEVFAMGMGDLATQRGAARLFAQDREMFDMIVGYISTKYSGLSQLNFDMSVQRAKDRQASDAQKADDKKTRAERDKQLLKTYQFKYKTLDELKEGEGVRFSELLWPAYWYKNPEWLGFVVKENRSTYIKAVFGVYKAKKRNVQTRKYDICYAVNLVGERNNNGELSVYGGINKEFSTLSDAIEYIDKKA